MSASIPSSPVVIRDDTRGVRSSWKRRFVVPFHTPYGDGGRGRREKITEKRKFDGNYLWSKLCTTRVSFPLLSLSGHPENGRPVKRDWTVVTSGPSMTPES